MSDKKTFLEKAIAGLSNLTRLEVNTLVGSYSFNKTDNINTTINVESVEDRMCSQINLITGDITTAMTEKFVVDYKELREYHTLREEQGHAIINKNIETLKQIIDTLRNFEKEAQQP
ncbi:MAG: hypothetical protein WCI92_09645 [Bacteroidota bacterium]